MTNCFIDCHIEGTTIGYIDFDYALLTTYVARSYDSKHDETYGDGWYDFDFDNIVINKLIDPETDKVLPQCSILERLAIIEVRKRLGDWYPNEEIFPSEIELQQLYEEKNDTI